MGSSHWALRLRVRGVRSRLACIVGCHAECNHGDRLSSSSVHLPCLLGSATTATTTPDHYVIRIFVSPLGVWAIWPLRSLIYQLTSTHTQARAILFWLLTWSL